MFSIKHLKTIVKATFYLPPTLVVDDIEAVYLCGEFNNWDERVTPMKLSKRPIAIPFNNGSRAITYRVTIDLELNSEYQFRYLVIYKDGSEEWYNDWDADGYVPNPFGGDNSVISTF